MTAEAEPAAAAELFGEGIDRARAFAADLVQYGEELGLIGPAEVERVWTRHLLNCVLVAQLVRPGRVADVGSGAGLPGLVLAIARPDAELVLVEPMERRTEWLAAQSERLGLPNVTVVRGRAEDVRLTPRADQVTARAVSALVTLIPLCARLLKPGGELLLMKGARVAAEMAAAGQVLRDFGVRDPEVVVLGEGVVPEVTRVFRARVD